MKIEIGKISHSRKILVSPPLRRQSKAPPDVPTLAPPPSSLSCLTNLFRKIFSCTEMKPSIRPKVRSPRRPLLQIQWRFFINEQ